MQAYRSLTLPVDLGDRTFEVSVPLTIGLLRRLEETIEETTRATSWWRLNRKKAMLDAFIAFAEPYLPVEIDRGRIQPAFYPLFFSHVRRELLASLNGSMNSTSSTETPPGPTDGRSPAESA